MRAVAILILASILAGGAAPASKPAKPLTYAELKAENERLKAEVERLRKEIEDAKPAPSDEGPIRVGMTLQQAEAVPGVYVLPGGRKSVLESESEKTKTYRLGWSDSRGPGRNAVTWTYTLDVQDGKIVSMSRQ